MYHYKMWYLYYINCSQFTSKNRLFSPVTAFCSNLILENKLWFTGNTLLVYLKRVELSGGCEYVNRMCLYNTWKWPEVVLKRLCGMLNRDASSVQSKAGQSSFLLLRHNSLDLILDWSLVLLNRMCINPQVKIVPRLFYSCLSRTKTSFIQL